MKLAGPWADNIFKFGEDLYIEYCRYVSWEPKKLRKLALAVVYESNDNVWAWYVYNEDVRMPKGLAQSLEEAQSQVDDMLIKNGYKLLEEKHMSLK